MNNAGLELLNQIIPAAKSAAELYPDVKQLYHLSVNEGITQLKPLRGEFWADHKKKIKRVSVADTLHGCVQALMLPNWNQDYKLPDDDDMSHVMKNKKGNTFMFYVYGVDPNLLKMNKILNCDKFDMKSNDIFDILMTGEIAYKDHLDCTYLGKIVVNMLSRSEHQSKYGPLHKLPITAWCTQPRDTPFFITPLDSTIVTADEDIRVLLDDDLVRYKARLKSAFNRYIDYIKYNADRNKVVYQTAYSFL